jgi:hypothetical protein
MGHPNTILRKIRHTYDRDSVECESCGKTKSGKLVNIDVCENDEISRDRKRLCNSCYEEYRDWYENRCDQNGWVRV